MTPREVVATAAVPGGEPLRLVRHGDDFAILLDRNELMSSRAGGSEAALGAMTCERLAKRRRGFGAGARLLIGGYGMGFTLRAVLAGSPADARVTVAELLPEIIEWARGPMAALTDGRLDDPRVELVVGDVAAVMASGGRATDGRDGGGWDAVLLDVDNGPHGLTRAANEGLYSPGGLARARAALKPDGVLAVWSAGPDAAFARRLAQAGFAADEMRVRARQNGKGPTHVIWFATPR